MTTWITVCDTCMEQGRPDKDVEEFDGARFAGLIEGALADRLRADPSGTAPATPAAPDAPKALTPAPAQTLRVRRHSCLMGCANGCNVAIQSEGKLNYTLGGFAGLPDEAEAIVDYARLHAASPMGQVPYRQWPQPIKGHFVTRHPPLPGTEPEPARAVEAAPSLSEKTPVGK